MRSVTLTRRLAAALATLVPLLAAPAGAAADPQPFGHPCTAQYGVRFCPTSSLAQRVASWDGVPLDADVTLPATGSGPWPTIVILPYLGGDKTTYEATSPGGNGFNTYDFNNVFYAQHGYAVVTYTARGFGNSCGVSSSRTSPGCDAGWSHFADQRYEARDTQYLLGQLADERIASPSAIGLAGESIAGTEAVELAYLKNRIRLPGGSFAPWTSPAGTPLSIGAVWALWPATDFVQAVMPNGTQTETSIPSLAGDLRPVGVLKLSELYDIDVYSQQIGWLPSASQDPSANLNGWFSDLTAGEPYGTAATDDLTQMYDYHQGYGLSGQVAPLLIQSGWDDDLVGVDQALAVYNQQRALNPAAPVTLQLGDLGHPVGANKTAEIQAYADQAASLFAAYLQGSGTPPAPGSVSAYAITCPSSAPAGGPWTAPSYGSLATGSYSFGSAAVQTVSSSAGSAQLAQDFDPFLGGSNACRTDSAETDPGTAVYTRTSPGLTMMGAPTVTATVNTLGQYGQLPIRLWDVAGGQQRLITRGVLRLGAAQAGPISVQLAPAAYTFGAGDTIKLEVLGRDYPYLHTSNGSFSVQLSNLTVSLPTAGSWVELVSQTSGKCLDAAGWGTGNGTSVQQWTCGTAQPNQEWQLQPVSGGAHEVLNRNASSGQEVLDVSGGPTATGDGVKVQLWTYGAATNQQWRAVPLGNGYDELVAQSSGKCLDDTGGSTANGTQLQQWTCTGGPNQAFKLVPQP